MPLPSPLGSEANAHEFIPERWLQNPGETEEAYQARFSKMKSTDFTFGAGSRACLGRYLSQLESAPGMPLPSPLGSEANAPG
jgi:cytochrome P450